MKFKSTLWILNDHHFICWFCYNQVLKVQNLDSIDCYWNKKIEKIYEARIKDKKFISIKLKYKK